MNIRFTPVADQHADALTGVQSDTVGIANDLHDITFSPDGTRYAYTSADSVVGHENAECVSVAIHETAINRLISSFEFDGDATGFAVSPDNDGQYLLVSTNAGLFYNANHHNGDCIRGYVPSSARHVSEHSPVARNLSVINQRGGDALLSCSSAIQVGR